MVFSSLMFLFQYLPIVLLLNYLVPKRMRNIVLFIASLIFYAWGEPIYIVLMIFSTVVDYTCGRLVDYYLNIGNRKKAKLSLICSILINLGLLGFFKYTDFLIEIVNKAANTKIPLLSLALPIGISFYTFQTMSYTIDIYLGRAKVQKNILTFGTYVTLFPQLIAGPIVQYNQVDEQLRQRTESAEQFAYGVHRFIIGLGKKVLLANTIGVLWSTISQKNITELPIATAWLGILAFAFQIYFDFSGYSDMAIGLGHLFGFRFLENFNYPYISKSITEFWRRWHISLGDWFRDYVYIPLGGSRNGLMKQIRNILIVWLLTGIWHGASMNFLFWGLYFAILLMLEKAFLLKYLDKAPAWISRLYAMFFVLLGWVIFAFDNSTEGISYLKTMFGGNNHVFADRETIYLLYNNAILLLIGILASSGVVSKLLKKRMEKITLSNVIIKNVYYLIILFLSVAYLVDASYNPFLYFRF